jgi:hypothetical protein
MGRFQRLFSVLFLLGALMASALNAKAENSDEPPKLSEFSLSPEIVDCLDACAAQIKTEVGPGKSKVCATRDDLEECLVVACSGLNLEWSPTSLDAVTNVCAQFGHSACGCGVQTQSMPAPQAEPPTKTEAKLPSAKKRLAQKSVARTLTPKEDCENRSGAWVTVEKPRLKEDGSESGETMSVQECVYLADAWMEIQTLKAVVADKLAKGLPFTDAEIARLKELANTKAEGPIQGEIRDLINAVKALCRAGLMTASVEAKGDGAMSLTAQCELMRQTIVQAAADAKKALEASGRAEQKADEAAKKADTADKKAERALNATRSNLRVVGEIGVYGKRTPDYGPAFKGDTTIVYAGGGMGWNPCFQSGVCLSLSGLIGSSITPIFGSRSYTLRAGAGLGTHLNKTVFIGGEVFGQHFVWPNEWSKLNVYGVQPIAVFRLARLGTGIDLVADARLQIAVMRGLKPAAAGSGIQQNLQIGLSGGLGIEF